MSLTQIHNSNLAGELSKVHNAIQVDPAAPANSLQIDQSGYMLTPNRPAFYACGSNRVSVGIALFGQSSIPVNQTNSYSSSNGLFTAPVSGVYHFSASHFGNVSVSGSAHFWWSPYKNGAAYAGTFHSINPTPFSHETLTGSWVCRLEFGDTMGVYFNNSGGASDWGDHYSHFSGYLIG